MFDRPRQTTKPFIVPKTTFKSHWRSSAIPSFVTSPGLQIRDGKSRLHYSDDLEGRYQGHRRRHNSIWWCSAKARHASVRPCVHHTLILSQN